MITYLLMKFNNMLQIGVFGADFGDLRFSVIFNTDYVSANKMLQVLRDFLGSERDDFLYVLEFADISSPYMSPYPCKFANETYMKFARYLHGIFPELYKLKRRKI